MKNILEAKLMGDFCISWNGKRIDALSGPKPSQDKHFLMLMLLNNQKGLSKDFLIKEVIGENTDIEDADHTIQSIVYNLKQKAFKGGVTKCTFLKCTGGMYRWDPSFQVVTDVDQIIEAKNQSLMAKNDDDKLQYLLNIIEMNKGPLLKCLTGNEFVEDKRKIMREIDVDSIFEASRILKEKGEYETIEMIGEKMSGRFPFRNAETIKMRALIWQEKYAEAEVYYNETVNHYLKHNGTFPSDTFMSLVNQIKDDIHEANYNIDSIMNYMREDLCCCAVSCSHSVFKTLFNLSIKHHKSIGSMDYLMLITVVDDLGNVIADEAILERYQLKMMDAITEAIATVKNVCCFNHFSRGQFLVILPMPGKDDVEKLQKEINKNLSIKTKSVKFSYSVRPIE